MGNIVGLTDALPNATGLGPVSTALADLNGDGILDMAVANSWWTNDAAIRMGTSDGPLGAATKYSDENSIAQQQAVRVVAGAWSLTARVRWSSPAGLVLRNVCGAAAGSVRN